METLCAHFKEINDAEKIKEYAASFIEFKSKTLKEYLETVKPLATFP